MLATTLLLPLHPPTVLTVGRPTLRMFNQQHTPRMVNSLVEYQLLNKAMRHLKCSQFNSSNSQVDLLLRPLRSVGLPLARHRRHRRLVPMKEMTVRRPKLSCWRRNDSASWNANAFERSVNVSALPKQPVLVVLETTHQRRNVLFWVVPVLPSSNHLTSRRLWHCMTLHPRLVKLPNLLSRRVMFCLSSSKPQRIGWLLNKVTRRV
mmetsp:Transcript_6582/g.20005  ORF Transcript_6582/g.20005 Transcript_6582/m.20005 type:complete len:206 (-) Transcript_6582:1100-1717(-)